MNNCRRFVHDLWISHKACLISRKNHVASLPIAKVITSLVQAVCEDEWF